jgi:hypothetical protein
VVIPCLAVFAGHGNGAGDGAAQLNDVRQVVLVPAVVLPCTSISQSIGDINYFNQSINREQMTTQSINHYFTYLVIR